MNVYWDITPCASSKNPDVSEKHIISIFMLEDLEDGGEIFL
jgi:hypothetical protein